MRCQLFFLLLCATFHLTKVSAQVHIGSSVPPESSAMLEISATDKGILLPSIALADVYDSIVIVNNQPVDGLLIYNTTENPSLNIYKGLYAWNSVKHLWENIVSDRSFNNMLLAHYAIEKSYFVANLQTKQRDTQQAIRITSGSAALLTFNTFIINRENCFADNVFTVPENGLYKVVCGIELYSNDSELASTDQVEIYLEFTQASKKTESTRVKVTRSSILPVREKPSYQPYIPLTPSLIYNGYLEKGVKIAVKVLLNSKATSGYLNRKYLYIDAL
ncbi:MAG: hypothetical protein LBB84_01105 [Tannerellaceae bacterium]|nr:hypothetical protein [Tannerellaceae bacterium]